ncbi:hypothetical protein SAMN04490248_1488 [Salinihabitans flavidus]|uniref:DUF4402 domain-containing protein n=1 Tax=Salinihabitans flavidus TaxID=569882 RepID=A0A1H8W828_9RHOB|nr:hypothetical protein [Salinihabitans flavidus]SEP23770.1 hypothetical protein SAMN04490248_1488 [Salinihabitans flavidus]
MGRSARVVRKIVAVTAFCVVLLARVVSPEAALSQTFGTPQTVSIAIQIGPIVEVSFPEGTTFSLEVASGGGALNTGIDHRRGAVPIAVPVEIPFEVRGNAHAVVSAMPGRGDLTPASDLVGVAKMRSDGSSVSDTAALRYRTVVEFPTGTHRGKIDTGRAMMRANVADSPMRGVVHVIPFGYEDTAIGHYTGSVEMAVYAEK